LRVFLCAYRPLPRRCGTQVSGSRAARSLPSNSRLSPPPHLLPFAMSSLTCTFSTRFEDGSRSPYTLSHLSVDGRFLLTYGPQRGLQLLDLHLRAVVLTIPAADTGALEAVFCGAQAPTDAAAGGPGTAAN
jgi:hypothetical protein